METIISSRVRSTVAASPRRAFELARPSAVVPGSLPAAPVALAAMRPSKPAMPGVGTYRVAGPVEGWPAATTIGDHCGVDATDTKFSTRLGPPSCSPPV